jgi:hypothetical protein
MKKTQEVSVGVLIGLVVAIIVIGGIYFYKKSITTRIQSNIDVPAKSIVDENGNGIPVITSITPKQGSVGTVIDVKGNNFAGFESDKYLWMVNDKGVKGVIYGELPISTNDFIRFTLKDKYCTVDTSYSGNPCPSYLTIVPGTYTFYAEPWGTKSNVVQFKVVAQ